MCSAVVVATTASTATDRALHAAHHAAGPALHARIASVIAARHQVQADAVRQELRQVAAEHQGGERDRQDHFDGTDDHVRR